MNCRIVAEHLNRYLDGEMDQVTATELRTHLDGCAACRTELSRLQRLGEFFAEPDSIEVPVSFHARVVAEARRRGFTPQDNVYDLFGWWRRAGMGMRFSAVSAALCCVTIGILLGVNLLPEPTQQAAESVVQVGEAYSLDYLSDSPQGSLAAAYNSIVDGTEGEGE